MFGVTVCWVITLLSGLWWSRRWTGVWAVVTGLLFVSTQATALAHWSGWLQLGVLIGTPWLLASQRIRVSEQRGQLHAQEAKEMMGLSGSARSLLSLQTSTQELEAQIALITEVYRVTKDTSRALHFSELFTASLESAPRLLDADGLRLIDLSTSTPTVLRATRLPDGRFVMNESPSVVPVEGAADTLTDVERTIVKHAMGSVRASSPSTQANSWEDDREGTRVAWAPLWREQRPIGVVIAEALRMDHLGTLAMVANQLSLQLSRIHLYKRVEAMAVTDALTGLFVRRHFLERAKEEIARSARHGLSCTLLMTDLDHFKQKNDTYGHLVGDVVLKDVAQILKRNLREVDLIARYGGEEFILLLIETTIERAMPIAQRLKQLVELHPIRAYDELLTQTISIGVAGFPDDGQTLEALIERADQALYAAKHAGRNQVIRASAVESG